ncbi:MAG TPA: hypothetical protein VFJ29_03255 [Candidatus Kapabacteria bacterium]|nr:hypothetical protein [Candidatus Kapabacteria bacterium]
MSIMVSKVLAYSVALVCVVFSILIFSGAVLGNIPSTYRTLFGVIVILYGIYRIVLSNTVRKREG